MMLPIKRVRALGHHGEGLAQQMSDVLPHVAPEDRLQTAYELALPWAPHLLPAMPECVQHMFA